MSIGMTVSLIIFCNLRDFDTNVVLTEHEYMGPNWTPEEGFILGVGAKMLTIAGPVIVYGISASVVYGFIYWLITRF